MSKVFWSDVERATIVRNAVDLAARDPNCTKLALLRGGISALPPERRRKVIAVSQAPWFLGMVAEEVKRRAMEERAAGGSVAAIRDSIVRLAGLVDLHERKARYLSEQGETSRKTQETLLEVWKILEETRRQQKGEWDGYMAMVSTIILLLEELVGEMHAIGTEPPPAGRRPALRVRDPDRSPSQSP